MPVLLEYLLKKYPLAKRQNLKRMVEEGRVTINGHRARRLKDEVRESDEVHVRDRIEGPKASLDPLKLIHEDGDILVIDKPAGLLTSTTEKEKRPTAIARIMAYLGDREPRARAGIIHRLDRDASGLLVFSKNHAAFEGLKRQFFEHSVERVYTAVVRGKPHPESARIESYLMELSDGRVVETRDREKGQVATTDYRMMESGGGLSLLQVTLQTGRKHQIRAHLAGRGHAIVGDAVYGEPGPKGRLLLAATTLALTHPTTGERMTFQIAPPEEIIAAMKSSQAKA